MANINIDEALASLEALMSEFFAPATNNMRKREIENILETFSNRPDSWKHCLSFLKKSQNQYVLMFTLTTLENIINKQWMELSNMDKTEIRLTLWNELVAKHEVMIYFIRNKLAALMVSIARHDWPHLYPEFFDNIVELVESHGQQALLGLVLASAASEELGGGSSGGGLLPSARRVELERLMLRGVPRLLHALTAILERNAQKEGHTNPPPSPTSGIPQTSVLPDLLANAHDVTPLDKNLQMELVVKCLTTLQHLFSWLPLSSHVPPSLVTTVFHWGSIATQSQSPEAALCGLSGVCELLYRRYCPPTAAATALRLHLAALRLAAHLTRHPAHILHAQHDYLNKFAEFLKLFVSLHFKRLETEPEFDAIEFLSYLFQYTFQVPTCAIFINCLEIWIQFMDVLKPEDIAKYWEPLQALVNEILNKMMFQHNKSQLQHLDDETCDDDGETEWQTFLKHCIECIARVGDLAPLDVFTLVCDRWQGLAGVYARAAGRPSSTADGERLLAALLDLATLTRALGRLAPALLSEEEPTRRLSACSAGASLIDKISAALTSAALCRPQSLRTHAYTVVHAEMFACMGAWSCYIGVCNVPPSTTESLLSSALPFLLPREPQEPPLLCHAAARLLLSLSKNVKFTYDPVILVGDLYSQAQSSLHYLEPKSANLVREALVCLCAGGGVVGSGVGVGSGARALLMSWGSAVSSGPAALPALTSLLHAFTDANTHTKKILAEGMSEAAETALRMLVDQRFASAETELTDFFLALFTCLLHQLGHFPYNAIDVFLQVAQRGGSSVSLERVLECVRLGVEGGGSVSNGGVQVSSVLQLLSLQNPPPAGTDVSRATHKLLASLLIHRWRYFFPTKVEPEEQARRSEELRKVLSAIGRALLEPDPEVLRLHLQTLDTLNTKWRLYHKAIFRTEFLCSFLSVLLGGAGERGGATALLREEVLSAVHAMAAVDFAAFRTGFLPAFLNSLPGLAPQHAASLAAFPSDTDLPTFTQNIQRLMNDVNYYSNVNLNPLK